MNDSKATNTTIIFRNDRMAFAVAGLALLVRWIHLAIIWNSDLIRIPIIDSAFYHQWAMKIASGEFAGQGVFFMSPLYPYFLGLVYSIFGVNAGMALILQSIMGALTIYLLYLWVEDLLDARHALLAAGLGALYSPFIFYDGSLLTSTLILFLSAVILVVTNHISSKQSTWLLLSIGVLVGLSALARPLVLLTLPVVWWVLFLKEKVSSARRWMVVLSGTAIILFSVGIRNLIVGGEFTLTTSSAGMNFYVGNNPDATGLYWEAPFMSSAEPQYEDDDYRRVASEAVGRKLTTREAGSYWFRKSLDWMINHPVDYLKLLGTKAFYFWNRAEFANNVSLYLGRDISPVLKFNPIGFWLIAPLGLAGLILLWRRKGKQIAALPVGWTLAYFAGGLIFFISSEYRLPTVLPLLLGASVVLLAIIDDLRRHHIDAALKVMIIPLVILPVVNFRTKFISEGENARMDWFNIANTLLKNDEAQAAVSRFERSLAVDPYFAEAMLRLAEANYRSGDMDAAIEIGKRAGLPDPESILKLVQGSALQEAFSLLNEGNLARAMKEFRAAGYDSVAAVAETTRVSLLNAAKKAFESGNVPKSLENFMEILAVDTTREPAIYYNIAFLHFQLGHVDSAESFAKQALEIDSLNGPASSLLAKVYSSTGRELQAQEVMRRISPEGHDKEGMLAVIRADMDSLEAIGEWERALDAYLPYGQIFFDIAVEDKWRIARLQYRVGNYDISLRLLNEIESAMIGNSGIALYQGWTYMAMGRLAEAETAFQRCISLDREIADARISLARIYLMRGQVDKAWKELDGMSDLQMVDGRIKNEYEGLLDTVKMKM